MAKRPSSLQRAIQKASEAYDADLYFYSGPIDDDGLGKIIGDIALHKQKDNAVLILTTHGGSANAGYQIARIFQKTYEKFYVCAPSICKSAGTLIALGAHKLLVDAFSDLGPLDVQLLKQNEIAARKSGLLSRASFEALSDAAFELYEKLMISITLKSGGLVGFRLASELSSSMASNLLAPVFAQINPDTVGSENRDLDVAMAYGLRLAEYSENAPLQSVLQLVRAYPSHDFIIDDDELKQLFENVETPSEDLYSVIGHMNGLAYDEAPSAITMGLTPPIHYQENRDEEDTAATTEGGRAGKQRRSKSLDEDRQPDRSSNPREAGQKGSRRRVRKPAATGETKDSADAVAEDGATKAQRARPLRIIQK